MFVLPLSSFTLYETFEVRPARLTETVCRFVSGSTPGLTSRVTVKSAAFAAQALGVTQQAEAAATAASAADLNVSKVFI